MAVNKLAHRTLLAREESLQNSGDVATLTGQSEEEEPERIVQKVTEVIG